jgi:hypothetical protein
LPARRVVHVYVTTLVSAAIRNPFDIFYEVFEQILKDFASGRFPIANDDAEKNEILFRVASGREAQAIGAGNWCGGGD